MLPKDVRIREVGPREGFQALPQFVATKDKVALIDLLSTTGLKEIEITSFVRPDLVPQMRDAAEVVKSFIKKDGVRYNALYLNQEGFEKAEADGRLDNQAWLMTACSETFLKKNANTSWAELNNSLPTWLQFFAKYKKSSLSLMVSTAFGCSYEGKMSPEKVVKVVSMTVEAIKNSGASLQEICLADTMGWANPLLVKQVIEKVRNTFPQQFISLHLHDTRGCGIANVYAGLEMGVTCFDSSIGGMGGCPFAEGAAGNVATEDVVYLCEEMGIGTGINLDLLVKAAKLAETLAGHELPGKYYKSLGVSHSA